MRSFLVWGIPAALLFAASAGATSVPRLSFEELTDHSEVIAQGQITRTWSAWDASHKYIWTHHEMAVAGAIKGTGASTVVISEPGGVVGGVGMIIAGSVAYRPGDKVLVFLERMPNGNLRTTGWGQGQYRVDSRGALRASESLNSVDLLGRGAGLTSLEGHTVAEITARVAARIRSNPAGAR